MHGFTISLARENAGFGITVNTISPGYVATDMVMAVPEDVRAKIIADIPTGRLGKPEEIAYGVSFLVAEEASWITGSNRTSTAATTWAGEPRRAPRHAPAAPADGHAAQHANPCCAT